MTIPMPSITAFACFSISIDQGEYQLYVPFVVVVKDGKAVSGHIGTVDGHDAHERKMTEKETQELKKIYEDMFSAVTK